MAMTILLQQSSCAATGSLGRCQASQVHPRIISQLKYDRSFFPKHNLSALRHLNAGFTLQIRRNIGKNMAVVHASAPPEAPLPVHHRRHSHHHHLWKFRILGTILTMFLSLFKGKWGPLLILKEKVETAIEEFEEISEVVEEVADKVEEAAEAAAKRLPEGKLHDAAVFVEKVAEEIEKDAHVAGHLLEKAAEIIERKVESFIDSHTHPKKTVVVE